MKQQLWETDARAVDIQPLPLLRDMRRGESTDRIYHAINESAHELRHKSLGGELLGRDAQLVEHEPRVRVAAGPVAEWQELVEHEGCHQVDAAIEEIDDCKRHQEYLYKGSSSEDVGLLILYEADQPARGQGIVLTSHIKESKRVAGKVQ